MPYSAKREKTESKIIHAYIDLIREKELSQITVKDVCQKTGINRSTFYTYFHDVYEMAEFVEQSLVKKISGSLFSNLDELREFTVDQLIKVMMDMLYENDNLPLIMIRRGSRDFEERFVLIILENLEKLGASICDENRDEIKMLMKYHLSGVAAMIDCLGDVEDEQSLQKLIVNAINAARTGPITAILGYLH